MAETETQTEKPDRDEENKDRLKTVAIEREITEGRDSYSRFEENVQKWWPRELFKVTAQELATPSSVPEEYVIVLEMAKERKKTDLKGLLKGLDTLNLRVEKKPVVHVYSVVHSEEGSKKEGRYTFIINATNIDTKKAISKKGLFERLQILRVNDSIRIRSMNSVCGGTQSAETHRSRRYGSKSAESLAGCKGGRKCNSATVISLMDAGSESVLGNPSDRCAEKRGTELRRRRVKRT